MTPPSVLFHFAQSSPKASRAWTRGVALRVVAWRRPFSLCGGGGGREFLGFALRYLLELARACQKSGCVCERAERENTKRIRLGCAGGLFFVWLACAGSGGAQREVGAKRGGDLLWKNTFELWSFRSFGSSQFFFPATTLAPSPTTLRNPCAPPTHHQTSCS